MGKRELLIVVAFVAVGFVLYRVTAPPARQDTGFSLRRLIDEIRADIRSDSTTARHVHTSLIDPPSGVTEVRLSGVTGRMVITGEDRSDIACELQVESTGPDEATAAEYARQTVLVEDDLGETLGLRVSYPPEARQRTEITLRLPRTMRLAVEAGSSSGNSAEIMNLQALRLEGVMSDVNVEHIAGRVDGSHRSGRLTVTDAGSVDLTLVSSRALFSAITGGITLNATRGETQIADSSGETEIEQSNNELRIERHAGLVRVSGSGGQIELIDPQGEVRIDVRRTEIEIALARAVAMTVITTEEPLRLLLDGPPAITVDAVVTGNGDLVADDFGLTGVTEQDQTKLTHTFGDATVRIALRNRRDDIVIRKR